MQRKFVGPMPVRAFLSSFLPVKAVDDPLRSSPLNTTESYPALPSDDSQLTSAFPSLRPTSHFSKSSTNVGHGQNLPTMFFSSDAQNEPTDVLALWRDLELFVDRNDTGEDPFQDPISSKVKVQDLKHVTFENPSSSANAYRRRLCSWAHTQFKHQSRIFAFSVVLFDKWARLVRWDRSGAVVTERFIWSGTEGPLAEFFRRFDDMSEEERGHDPTVSKPSDEQINVARAAFAKSDATDISPEEPLRLFTVADDVTGEERLYVVADSQWHSRSLAGRATFGYVAVDVSTGSVVYLKDTWRIDEPGMQKEGDVYRRLWEHGVPYIAPILCAGDVVGQTSRTQEFSSAEWVCGETDIVPHQRYRLVLGVVGRPLNTFKSTFELCTAVADAVEAHAHAFSLLNILHRDISAGNILITSDGRGLLIDWDLCRDLSLPVKKNEPLTGTWQFISGVLVNDPHKEHELSDDLESFVHVLAYHLLHHRPTGFSNLESDVYYVYHRRVLRVEENVVLGGMGKRDFFISVSFAPVGFRGHVPKPCAMLLRDLRHLFRDAFYADLDDVKTKTRQDCIEALKTPDRVLEIFRKHLAEKGWSRDDGCRDGLVGENSRVSTGKRKAIRRLDEDLEPPRKRSREDEFWC
ncbi:hypothetical protein OF83DRAFT_1241157 [Amylostereum chailletii]|nr:hypothetical protein OF83DRAFT_1241157 [Amylostereum chailletii]